MLTIQTTASTTELVQAAAGGDERAWELVVERYSPLVWSVVRTYPLAGRDAVDVVTTTWLQLAQNCNASASPRQPALGW